MFINNNKGDMSKNNHLSIIRKKMKGKDKKKKRKEISKKQSNKKVMKGKTQKKNLYAKKHTYKYVDKNNKTIKDKKTLEHIKTLRIPPGYNDVVISNSSRTDIQAIGTDDKGRKQYIYNPTFIKKKQTEKYENIIKLGENVGKIIKDINKIINASSKLPVKNWEQPTTNVALIIFLLYKCNFRIGNMKYVKLYKSYGALTLMPKHLKLQSSGKLVINFIGKKGVENTATISDKNIISMLMKLRNSVKNYIFENSTGNPINIIHINDFLRSYDEIITPKMFRTWYANYYFLEIIKKDINTNFNSLLEICEYKTKIKSYIKKCCEYVANKLNNTAAISKKSYLDSEIIDIFTKNPCKFIKFLEKNKYTSNNDLLIKIMSNIR